ncbi:lipopolysaccharide assembly protein LapA domain-containing protein [Frateuria hangzhouensis]|uniref:lipopolysaccharide assembly protein LapA domain-containing protein n=1 Tax=Frateuria hangzhouensis TaxID=2995589 RepID=UPI00226099BB|nr:lipopolysaccharide assembly protein LapA domain-containing protein [Frateuria sp. STR12]MCX7512404.1 lipopolysaccharide assembly protein LapA domain-containing protein [Frateuria sp. STR12]
MRLIALLILVLFVVVGVVVGALNADPVSYDLAFAKLTMPKGAGLLVALVIGWLLGGLTAWLGMSLRHRRVLRRARQSSGKTPARA